MKAIPLQLLQFCSYSLPHSFWAFCSLDGSHHDCFLPFSWLMSVFCLRCSPDFLSICSTRLTKICWQRVADLQRLRLNLKGGRKVLSSLWSGTCSEPRQSNSDILASSQTWSCWKSCQESNILLHLFSKKRFFCCHFKTCLSPNLASIYQKLYSLG